MRGSLGAKIGEGITADVHAWAPGQVVKLFKPGVSPRHGRHEARITHAAFAAGVPVPQVFDEVELDGRFGIVMSRLDGPALVQLLLAGDVTAEQVGTILATLYLSVHNAPPPPGAISLRDWVATASRLSRDILPEHIAAGVLALIDRLPPGDGLCHGDLHPGNVIVTADGPRIIDWACALRASAVFDIARAHISLSELVPEGGDPALPHAIDAAVQSGYACLAGTSPAELTAAMQPYLPILRCVVILQRRPMSPSQRERLLQRIAASLLSED